MTTDVSINPRGERGSARRRGIPIEHSVDILPRARGRCETRPVMMGLRRFGGWLFSDAIHLIIGNAAVSGGCFPSAQVSGTRVLTFGLHAEHPKVARWFGVVAAGLSVSSVYTRYHHGVDVLAGLAVAAIATAVGYRLTRGARSRK